MDLDNEELEKTLEHKGLKSKADKLFKSLGYEKTDKGFSILYHKNFENIEICKTKAEFSKFDTDGFSLHINVKELNAISNKLLELNILEG